jgi:hypothetical protein
MGNFHYSIALYNRSGLPAAAPEKRKMAHQVAFSVPERQLGKRDIVFRVSKDDALFGTLRVSKGGVDWFPLKKQLGYGFDWSRIDRLFRTQGDERRHKAR